VREGYDLLVAFAAFVVSVAVVVGIGLFVLSVVLRAQARHRKRLARVGRKRLTGELVLDEARMQRLRRKEEAGALVALAASLARFLPILDTQRMQANARRAGLTISVRTFILVALALGAALAPAAHLATGLSLALVAPLALFAGMYLVEAFVRLRGEMMTARLLKQLPEALDTIIRGMRAGLPVVECIGSVGQEMEEPLGGHFRAIAERVALGEPLDSAMWRVARTAERPEVDFLAVAIAIQMETGGSLGDALGNLSELLRRREGMKLKIKAISAEAKASALIIGALPFLMLALLSFMSPAYVAPLFTDGRGQMMLLSGLGSIGAGAVVMWRMTKFEI
jgi:tight adherence protein B